jgi:hypothetical protein
MERKIYIHQKNMNEELIAFFAEISDQITIDEVANDIIILKDQDFYNEEPVDFESFRDLLFEDFDSVVTIVIEPYLTHDFIDKKILIDFIHHIPNDVYYFEDIITYSVLKNNQTLKNEIKKFIENKTSKEVIHTVKEFIENNMNSSVSAKKLYMHRNTLNYRVDNFIEATKINVKTFKGANAFYMLYKF